MAKTKTGLVKRSRTFSPAAAKTLIGVLLILVAVAGIYYWETIGQRELNYTNTLVMAQDVKAGTEVTADMLGYASISRDSIIGAAITNPDDVLGKVTTGYVPKGAQLVSGYFTEKSSYVADDQYIFSIPSDWVYWYPSTLRKGDTVYLYPVHEEYIDNTDSELNKMDSSKSDFEAMTNDETLVARQLGEDIADPKYVIEATVKYVMDSSARAVRDDEGSPESRMDSTANTDSLEVIVTEDQYLRLAKYKVRGFQFVVLYKEGEN